MIRETQVCFSSTFLHQYALHAASYLNAIGVANTKCVPSMKRPSSQSPVDVSDAYTHATHTQPSYPLKIWILYHALWRRKLNKRLNSDEKAIGNKWETRWALIKLMRASTNCTPHNVLKWTTALCSIEFSRRYMELFIIHKTCIALFELLLNSRKNQIEALMTLDEIHSWLINISLGKRHDFFLNHFIPLSASLVSLSTSWAVWLVARSPQVWYFLVVICMFKAISLPSRINKVSIYVRYPITEGFLLLCDS